MNLLASALALALTPGVASPGPGPAAAPPGGPARADAPTPPRSTATAPERPSFRGTGLFVAAGLVAGVGLVQQALSYGVLRGTCGRAQESLQSFESFDGATLTPEQGEELAIAALLGLRCVHAAGPALMVRLQTPIYLGAAVGLVSAGGLLSGRASAFDDVFVRPRDRGRRAFLKRVIGGALLGAGVVLWGTSRIILVSGRRDCDRIGCFLAYDLATLQGSGALTITGAALLTEGIAHGRQRRRYLQIRDLGVAPLVGRSGLGVALQGRF